MCGYDINLISNNLLLTYYDLNLVNDMNKDEEEYFINIAGVIAYL